MKQPSTETEKIIAAMWDYNDPAATEARFLAWLDSTGAEQPLQDRLMVRTQIARTYSLRGNFDEAHATLDDIENEITSGMIAVRVHYDLERGRAFNSAGEADKAVPLFIDAWEVAGKAGLERPAIDAAHMLGIAAPPELQLDWNLKALAMVEESSDSAVKGWLGPMYNNIGWTYHDSGEFESALDYFRKGYAWRIEVDDAPGARIAKWTVGRVLRSLDRLDEALTLQIELEQESKDAGQPVDGFNCEELGELYLALEQPDMAVRYFRQAHEILSQDQWLVANESDRLARLKELGGE
ncbi:MAG: tetratricopeptide repeat protein [Candidatus Cloacimonetes bacterium]|nr:tetratricopeptide repeat protein [Candidatus Cloacimonadota bacterium]